MKNLFYKILLSLVIFSVNLQATTYKIIDLKASDELHATTQYATGINNAGQVTGRCCFGGKCYIYVWDQINGFAFTQAGGFQMGPGHYNPFINIKGEVSQNPINDLGFSYYIDSSKRLCSTLKGIIETSHKWDETCWLHVNNSGQILGNIIDNNGKTELVIFNEITKTITYINYLKYNIKGCDINENGWIVGYYYDGMNNHGILWTPEFGCQKLPRFRPSTINNLGIIAGSYGVEQGIYRAALWQQGQIIDLSEALKIDTDTTTDLLNIIEISDINDAGQMTGWGQLASNLTSQQAVVIIPID